MTTKTSQDMLLLSDEKLASMIAMAELLEKYAPLAPHLYEEKQLIIQEQLRRVSCLNGEGI